MVFKCNSIKIAGIFKHPNNASLNYSQHFIRLQIIGPDTIYYETYYTYKIHKQQRGSSLTQSKLSENTQAILWRTLNELFGYFLRVD